MALGEQWLKPQMHDPLPGSVDDQDRRVDADAQTNIAPDQRTEVIPGGPMLAAYSASSVDDSESGPLVVAPVECLHSGKEPPTKPRRSYLNRPRGK